MRRWSSAMRRPLTPARMRAWRMPPTPRQARCSNRRRHPRAAVEPGPPCFLASAAWRPPTRRNGSSSPDCSTQATGSRSTAPLRPGWSYALSAGWRSCCPGEPTLGSSSASSSPARTPWQKRSVAMLLACGALSASRCARDSAHQRPYRAWNAEPSSSPLGSWPIPRQQGAAGGAGNMRSPFNSIMRGKQMFQGARGCLLGQGARATG